jgi:predicted outer membrane repeat protein
VWLGTNPNDPAGNYYVPFNPYNTAPNGGGAIVADTLIINNCVFENNRATNDYGGAIHAPTLTITGSTFRNNQAGRVAESLVSNPGSDETPPPFKPRSDSHGYPNNPGNTKNFINDSRGVDPVIHSQPAAESMADAFGWAADGLRGNVVVDGPGGAGGEL